MSSSLLPVAKIGPSSMSVLRPLSGVRIRTIRFSRTDSSGDGISQKPSSSAARLSVTFDSGRFSHRIRGLYCYEHSVGHEGCVLSTYRHTTGLQVGYPAILPGSTKVNEIVDQIPSLEIMRDSQFDMMVALMARRTMVTYHWNELIKLDSVSFMCFEKDLLVAFPPGGNLAFIETLCPIWSRVEKEVSRFYGTQAADLCTV